LAHLLEVAISCEKGSPHAHAAGGYPDIIYRDAGTILCERRKNNSVFARNIFIHMDKGDIQRRNKVMELFFVVPGAAAFPKPIKEFTHYDGRQKYFRALYG
jgi:hypothetical protein